MDERNHVAPGTTEQPDPRDQLVVNYRTSVKRVRLLRDVPAGHEIEPAAEYAQLIAYEACGNGEFARWEVIRHFGCGISHVVASGDTPTRPRTFCQVVSSIRFRVARRLVKLWRRK